MSAPAITAAELARTVADCFEEAGVPYAIGGAIAYGIWAIPRATQDVDVTVFVDAQRVGLVFHALRRIGAELDEAAALASATERGDFRATVGGMRLDVFTPSIPFYATVQQRRQQVEFRGKPMWVLSPEDLAVFKMLFFRPKDLLDLERLLAFLSAGFDRKYVRHWLVDMVGDEDARVVKWDELTASWPANSQH